MRANDMLASPVFILLLNEVLVATDIAMIIEDLRPDARVVVARSNENAAEDVQGGRIEVAFVQCDAAQLSMSPLGQRLSRDGSRLIFVGREQSDVPDGVRVLPFPFKRADVAALLGRDLP